MSKNLSLQVYIPFSIILANFIVQIPYTVRLYGARHLVTLTPGWFAMVFVLLLFLFGFIFLLKKKVFGYWMLFAFLCMEFLFYFFNEISGLIHGYGITYHVMHDDPLLKIVFLIGFLNLFASGYFLFLLIYKKSAFLK